MGVTSDVDGGRAAAAAVRLAGVRFLTGALAAVFASALAEVFTSALAEVFASALAGVFASARAPPAGLATLAAILALLAVGVAGFLVAVRRLAGFGCSSMVRQLNSAAAPCPVLSSLPGVWRVAVTRRPRTSCASA